MKPVSIISKSNAHLAGLFQVRSLQGAEHLDACTKCQLFVLVRQRQCVKLDPQDVAGRFPVKGRCSFPAEVRLKRRHF